MNRIKKASEAYWQFCAALQTYSLSGQRRSRRPQDQAPKAAR